MPLQSDHKALIFIASVAVLGAGVRVLRAAGRDEAPAVQPALERQAQAADSSARAGRGGKGRGRRASTRPTTDSTRRATARDSAAKSSLATMADGPGHIRGKLDLDVASAPQLDSLPGVSAAMAKRIVADRLQHGPFLNRDGLRRVSGVGPAFLARIDSLVTFSGTYRFPEPVDTVIPRPATKRGKASTRPAALRRGAPQPAPWRHATADTFPWSRESMASRRRAT
ncbi:MAG: Helix-hairpin-helix DNA-binding class 1 [Gemmatimonadetes bacterium]|nr:Helix-hairpin-helix DNA-binding class 1 [Gemmatimonadota bacterium]